MAASTEATWSPYVTPDRDRVVVKPHGELDLATVPELAEQVDDLEKVGFKHMVLDLQEVTFIDSTAIHFMIQRAKTENVEYEIRAGNEVVQHAFDLAGVTSLFQPRQRNGTE